MFLSRCPWLPTDKDVPVQGFLSEQQKAEFLKVTVQHERKDKCSLKKYYMQVNLVKENKNTNT